MLTIPMVFEVVQPGESRYWRSQNIREMMVEHGDSVRRTIKQRVEDVTGYKEDMEKESTTRLSSEKLHRLNTDNIPNMARSSEKNLGCFCGLRCDGEGSDPEREVQPRGVGIL